jgi:tight adherence protein B
VNDPLLIALLGGCSVLSIVLGVWLPPYRRRRAEARRLREFVGPAEAPSGPAAGGRDTAAAGRAPGWLERRTAGAKVDLAASELVLLMLVFASGTTALVFAATGHAHPITGLVAAAIGATVPLLWLRWREGAIASRFVEQLPDTVAMLANGVRAGLTLKQAVAQVVRDAPEPTAGELRPVERALGLGLTLDDALGELLRRRRSDDLALLVSAMSLHAQVGGNLARTLDAIAEALRERSRIQRDVSVLTSQQRYSAYVLAGLPIVVAVALYLVSPDYFGAMFAYALTRVAIVLAALMVVAGFILMRAVAAVDV